MEKLGLKLSQLPTKLKLKLKLSLAKCVLFLIFCHAYNVGMVSDILHDSPLQ